MPMRTVFTEISVLIPGYSVDDLSSDLAEAEASSLWNAISCAWHPRLLAQTSATPSLQNAETHESYSGKRVILVPTASESWMPHEWRESLSSQDHIVLDSCTEREEWLQALEDAIALPTPDQSSEPIPEVQEPILREDFLALGATVTMLQLISRRRHHYVDPDTFLLEREVRAAAEAACIGDRETTQKHLQACFDHLLDIREQVYPQDFCIVDICLAGAEDPPESLVSLLDTEVPVNLMVSAREILRLTEGSPAVPELLKREFEAGRLELLSGHDIETRTTLGSMASLIRDLRRGLQMLQDRLGIPVRHWARRRFGLTAGLPAVLQLLGFRSALHVALDDGLYPDKERGQYDWASPGGAIVAASSRIPLAIDSAAGFQRLADVSSESMAEDHIGVLFLARLAQIRTPWLQVLQRAAAYAPVLGKFVTMETLCELSEGARPSERTSASEYLSPALIHSSVLRTESPVSGPARLRQLQQQLESCRSLVAMGRLIKVSEQGLSFDDMLLDVDQRLADLELRQLEQPEPGESADDHRSGIEQAADSANRILSTLQRQLAEVLAERIPTTAADTRGLLLTNPLPFSRVCDVLWPNDWQDPEDFGDAVEAAERGTHGLRMLVRTPPGGFVWLHECTNGGKAQKLTEAGRREPPLAESLVLRNRHFEVTLSQRTGGIAQVTWHGRRGNRLSQHCSLRFEREVRCGEDEYGDPIKTNYAMPRLVSSRVVAAGTVFASVETETEILSPEDGAVLGRIVQTTELDRVRPSLRIRVQLRDLKDPVKGNPWLAGWCSRFAWENQASSITRSALGQAAGFRMERIESPDYVEVADGDHRMVIVAEGRPWFRKSGSHMLDAILVCESETSREFSFRVDFDEPHPLRTAEEDFCPVVALQTSGKLPGAMKQSWILGLSQRSVQLVSAEYQQSETEGGIMRVILSETEGWSGNCYLRTARAATQATLCSADPAAVNASLAISDRGVCVPMTGRQVREIELKFS